MSFDEIIYLGNLCREKVFSSVSENKFMKIKFSKKKIIVFSVLMMIFIILSFLSYIPKTEVIELNSGKNAVSFALVSDLHSCRYGKNQNTLVNMIEKSSPDVVFLTGDIFDDKIPFDNAEIFLEQIAAKYRCFYVSGNHEVKSGKLSEIKSYLRKINVEVLEGNCVTLDINGRLFDISGIDDPFALDDERWKKQLSKAYSESENQKILLTHRPEKVSEYKKYGFDLIVSGHAHGGQWLIPFLNRGVLVPNQGFFAKYVNGKYDLNDKTKMVVSRGLARESTHCPRLFNCPEIVIIKY